MEEKKIYDSCSESAALWVNRRAHANMQASASASNHSHGVYIDSRSGTIALNNIFTLKKRSLYFLYIFEIYKYCLKKYFDYFSLLYGQTISDVSIKKL